MAYKKDIKAWLKEVSMTEAQIDELWKDLEDTNSLVARFIKQGIDWRTLNMQVIRDIPTQKEADLKRIEEARIAEEQAAAAEQQRKEAAKYYEDNFEAIMVKKIDSGEDLSEGELKRLAQEHGIDLYEGENGRWSQSMQTIVSLCGRTFAVDWQSGLTEMQDDSYYDQPYEVQRHEYEKVIKVVEWHRYEK